MLTFTKSPDPKPYIRTFEAVLHELERTQAQMLQSEHNCAIEVQNSEMKHCQNIITSSQTISDILRDFGELDDTVGDISTATSILNGKLEKLSFQYENVWNLGFNQHIPQFEQKRHCFRFGKTVGFKQSCRQTQMCKCRSTTSDPL